MDGAAGAKQALRTRARAQLATIGPSRASEAGERIAAIAAVEPSWRAAATIALFKAIRGEVDTDPLVRLAWAGGKRVLLPRVVGDALVFHLWTRGESLTPGALGVLEPDAGAPVVAVGAADLVFVPGLAFDRAGGRLGRGAGYYDRALAGLGARAGSSPLVGLGFALQLVDDVPMTSLDVRLDGLVTEEGWIHFA